ncbi:hypothetical protein ABZP36_020859 [Zizania latifolia]
MVRSVEYPPSVGYVRGRSDGGASVAGTQPLASLSRLLRWFPLPPRSRRPASRRVVHILRLATRGAPARDGSQRSGGASPARLLLASAVAASPPLLAAAARLGHATPRSLGRSGQSAAFKKAPGDAPANVTVGIACLGGSSAFIGKMLADILKENNVNNQGLLFDPHARTALAFARFFHHGSISVITEPCKTAHIAAAKAAKDAGISEEEVSFLMNREDPHDSVVKKLEFIGRVGGVKVDAVDTTGAGDAFVAGILPQLAVDFSLLQRIGLL